MGLNLEVPGAALVADLLAPEVEFFSVGTNDLVQYLLAADRNDPRVAGVYQPLHPAVLRTLVQVVAAAEGQQRAPLGVRRDGRGAARTPLLLVGLGFRELSMSPAAHPAREGGDARRARGPRARGGVPVPGLCGPRKRSRTCWAGS